MFTLVLKFPVEEQPGTSSMPKDAMEKSRGYSKKNRPTRAPAFQNFNQSKMDNIFVKSIKSLFI